MKNEDAKRRNFEAQALPLIENLYCAAQYMVSEAEAQDSVVEALVKDYSSGHDCEFCPNRRTRLFRIMANSMAGKKCSTAGSKSVKSSDSEVTVPTSAANQEEVAYPALAAIPALTLERVNSVVRKLPDDYRLALILSLREGFSYRQIAHIVGTDLGTVRARLHHGRRLLRKGLFDHIDECASQPQDERTGCQEANHG